MSKEREKKRTLDGDAMLIECSNEVVVGIRASRPINDK